MSFNNSILNKSLLGIAIFFIFCQQIFAHTSEKPDLKISESAILIDTIVKKSDNIALTNEQIETNLPAFPGAEGFGAYTVGGRGGKIIYVTNLNDAGAGSFREACAASGARIVVFSVGGMIDLRSTITISNPYITIAGQTAPGDGICLRMSQTHPYGEALFRVAADETIIRFIRLRRGPGIQGELSGDAITVSNFYGPVANVIIDHCSVSWSTDELINSWYDVSNFTVQNCIASEALKISTHEKGEHSKGPFFGDNSRNISLFRNYICHTNDRNGYYVFDQPGQTALFEHVNNVTYNWTYFGNNYGSRWGGIVNANVIGNYMIAGPDTRKSRYEIGVGEHETTAFTTQLFVSNNLGPHRRYLSDPEWNIVGYNVNYEYQAPTDYQASVPFETPLLNKSLMPQSAYDYVVYAAGAYARLDENGAWVYNRDATDARVIKDMITRKPATIGPSGYYGIIDDPSEVGGWDTYASGTAYPDTDLDGMADAWETQNSLNPNDPSDANQTNLSSEGYTNIEMFINISDTVTFTQYSLSSSIIGSGSISPEIGTYSDGAVVTLEATPDAGYIFSGWSGDVTSNFTPAFITMDSDKSVTATFTAIPTYNLATTVVGSGSVSASPIGEIFLKHTIVSLTATADQGYVFSEWSGDLTGTINPKSFFMDRDMNITANFIQDPVGIENPYQNHDIIWNYPNPLSSETTFEYNIPHKEKVRLSVHNTLGQVVAILVDENQDGDHYKIVWDGTDDANRKLSGGLYFYQLIIGSETHSRKLIIQK